MAYVSTEIMTEARANIKKVLQKYGVKGTLSGKGSSTIRLKLTSGKVDFAKDAIVKNHWQGKVCTAGSSVNVYHYKNHFSGISRGFLEEAIEALKTSKFFDESVIESDFFYRSHYFDIQIGKYNEPYQVV